MTDRGRTIDLRADPDADLSEVVRHLRSGGAVAYPTETVYGLGALCTDAGVRTVREVKRRSEDKPFIALVESRDVVSALSWTPDASDLTDIFWPGSLTVVLSDPDRTFPSGVRDERTGTVAVRVSPHPIAARLVRELGEPLISTSLNLPGEPPVTSGGAAGEILDRMGADDVWLLDGGALPPSGPSTVVDCSSDRPVVLREGAVPLGRLRCALPEVHGRTD